MFLIFCVQPPEVKAVSGYGTQDIKLCPTDMVNASCW